MDQDWRVTNIWQLIEPTGLAEVSQGGGWLASKRTGRGALHRHRTLEQEHVERGARMLWGSAAISPVGRRAFKSMALRHLLCYGPLQLAAELRFLIYPITDDLQMVSCRRILFFLVPVSFLFFEPMARNQRNGRTWGGLEGWFIYHFGLVVDSGLNTQHVQVNERSFTLISEGCKEPEDKDHCFLLLQLEKQQNIVAKSRNPRATPCGFKCQRSHLPALRPWKSYPVSLCSSFLIC